MSREKIMQKVIDLIVVIIISGITIHAFSLSGLQVFVTVFFWSCFVYIVREVSKDE